jgi:hypothetical protein
LQTGCRKILIPAQRLTAETRFRKKYESRGQRMKSCRGLILPLLLFATLGGCRGGGGGGSIDTTPSISNLSFSPTSALQGDGNGSITVTGSVSFNDPGGDLTTLHLTNSQGQNITVPISSIAGMKSGTLQGKFTASTQNAGHYTFEVYVSDSLGHSSNKLSGSFDVNPAMHWTERTLPVPSGSYITLTRVVWSGTLFVAVGDDIFTSTDAVTWTEQSAGFSGTLLDVTWTGSQFIAVGQFTGGAVLTSPDGSTWTPQQVPSNIGAVLRGVAASSTRIIAVGSQNLTQGPLPAKGLMLSSTDGIAWSQVQMPVSATLEKIVWTGIQFVAVGTLDPPASGAVALTSPDGVTWTNHAMYSGAGSKDIAWNGSRFVAVGGEAVTSVDGVTWQQTGAGVVSASAIGWNGQSFVACGMAGCYTSSDGNQWMDGVQLPGVNPDVTGLAWGDNKWVAVGSYSLLLTSP